MFPITGHSPVIQSQSSPALFTGEIPLWQLCKCYCPSLHFQERVKWHSLKFAKCHLKSIFCPILLFSFRESEKGWRYLDLLKSYSHGILKKVKTFKTLLHPCACCTVPTAWLLRTSRALEYFVTMRFDKPPGCLSFENKRSHLLIVTSS